MRKLSARQKLFCDEYLISMNASNAATKAGYSEASSKEIACANLKKPHIKDYIQNKQKASMKKFELTRDAILTRLNERSLLMGEIQRLSLKESLTKEEKAKLKRLTEIMKMSDANKSDEMIARMLGFNEPDKLDVMVTEYKAQFGN